MKPGLRFAVAMAFAVALSIASVQGQDDNETLGDKLKKLFHRPTPTATPRRSHWRSSPPSAASPNGTAASLSGEASQAAVPTYGETPSSKPEPSASVASAPPIEAKTPETQYFEPVRPINPGPRGQTLPTPAYSGPSPAASAAETPSASPQTPDEVNPEERPTPNLPPVTGSVSSDLENSTREAVIPSASDIVESEEYPEEIRKLIELSLTLAKKNLTYKYASADPANGGLDCSGFIYYVLTKSGIKNVPRDASEQYVWVRKAGNFQAVLAHADDTFELDALRPGDLLFWANNSASSREPEIAQIMIYLGHAKASNQRLMVGATEGSTYQDEKRSGVGVFDFKLAPARQDADERSTTAFVGYGRFPDLSGN